MNGIATARIGDAERATWGVAALLAGVQLWILTEAYRITADDVLFLERAMGGVREAWDTAGRYAFSQGRIGSFYLIPVNLATSYLAEHAIFRILTVLLYLGHFLLFALYVQALLGARIAAPLFLLLCALNVTAPLHLPPVSYPLQNIIPFLLILATRLALLRLRRDGAPGRRGAEAALGLVFALALLATEYAFLFGTALLAAEHATAVARQGLGKALRSRHLAMDLAATALAFGIYAAFRMAYPSRYSGNHIAPLSTLPAGFYTAFRHAFEINALALREGLRPAAQVHPGWWGISAMAGLAAAYGSWRNWAALAAIPAPFVVGAIAALLSLYVVLPAAMTVRIQDWCLQSNVCIYLDSSTAYPGTIVVVLALSALVDRLAARRGIRAPVAMALSIGLGLWTAATILHDRAAVQALRPITDVWEGARALACSDFSADGPLGAVFDPQARLPMHPWWDREGFWQKYHAHFSQRC